MPSCTSRQQVDVARQAVHAKFGERENIVRAGSGLITDDLDEAMGVENGAIDAEVGRTKGLELAGSQGQDGGVDATDGLVGRGHIRRFEGVVIDDDAVDTTQRRGTEIRHGVDDQGDVRAGDRGSRQGGDADVVIFIIREAVHIMKIRGAVAAEVDDGGAGTGVDLDQSTVLTPFRVIAVRRAVATQFIDADVIDVVILTAPTVISSLPAPELMVMTEP